jgi:acyl dehydratase
MRLHLEDVFVGQRFHAGPVTVSVEDIKRFANEFDPQPFHLNEEEAQRSLFRGLVASGWHTASLTMRMLTDGGAPFVGGAIGAGGEVEWPRPVRPGDVLSVESEVLEVAPSRSRPDRGIVVMRTITSNQRGEAVQILTAKMIVFARKRDR